MNLWPGVFGSVLRTGPSVKERAPVKSFWLFVTRLLRNSGGFDTSGSLCRWGLVSANNRHRRRRAPPWLYRSDRLRRRVEPNRGDRSECRFSRDSSPFPPEPAYRSRHQTVAYTDYGYSGVRIAKRQLIAQIRSSSVSFGETFQSSLDILSGPIRPAQPTRAAQTVQGDRLRLAKQEIRRAQAGGSAYRRIVRIDSTEGEQAP